MVTLLMITMVAVVVNLTVMMGRSRTKLGVLSEPCLGCCSSAVGVLLHHVAIWVGESSISAKRFGSFLQNSTTGGALVSLCPELCDKTEDIVKKKCGIV